MKTPSSPAVLEPLLKVGDVARLENVCEKTILRRIDGGLLKAIKTGRHWRIRPQDLRDYRNERLFSG